MLYLSLACVKKLPEFGTILLRRVPVEEGISNTRSKGYCNVQKVLRYHGCVCIHASMYVCMYEYVRKNTCIYIHVCLYAFMYFFQVSIYVCTNVKMYVCMNICKGINGNERGAHAVRASQGSAKHESGVLALFLNIFFIFSFTHTVLPYILKKKQKTRLTGFHSPTKTIPASTRKRTDTRCIQTRASVN